MPRALVVFLLLIQALPALCQTDTAFTNYRKLFKRKGLPYYANYTDKEFTYDSIRNTTDRYSYIRYKSQVMAKPAELLIPARYARKYLQLDTVMVTLTGDTCHAEFYALCYIMSNNQAYAMIVERQFVGYYYRASSKHLITYSRRGNKIGEVMLASETPGAAGIDNYDPLYDRFNELPWFSEVYGVVRRNLGILIEHDHEPEQKLKLNRDGTILRKPEKKSGK